MDLSLAVKLFCHSVILLQLKTGTKCGNNAKPETTPISRKWTFIGNRRTQFISIHKETKLDFMGVTFNYPEEKTV
jgi:hypothetical protein